MIGPSFTNSALIRSNSSSSVAPVPGPRKKSKLPLALTPFASLAPYSGVHNSIGVSGGKT
jgi:hypothetical protein